MKTCAVVAASDFNSDYFNALHKDARFHEIIAVDGGMRFLELLGIIPHCALGDFDSLGYVPENEDIEQVFTFPSEKDKSDLELALEYVIAQGFEHLWIFGALGGRLDHTIANIQLLALYAEHGLDVTMIGMDCEVRYVVGPSRIDLPLRQSGTVSVFSLTPESYGVTEIGLKYALDGQTLSNRTTRGLSNEFVGTAASIQVEQGTLLVIIQL